MGCCSSSAVKSPSAKMAVEIVPTVKSEVASKDVASPEKIKIEIIIPRTLNPHQDYILTTAENSDDSGKSVSPTGVSQRSRRKSVTFNPISTIKEYRRDSSSTDKDYITYFSEQLGFDTLSDTDSTDGIEDDTEECDVLTQSHSPTFGPAATSDSDPDADEEWLRYEAELLRESEIDPSDPRYLQDYDIEYDPDYSLHHARSFKEPSCIWACS